MDDIFRTTLIFLFLCFIVLSHQTPFAAGDGRGGATDTSILQEEKPSLAKMVTDSISTLKKSHENSWGKIKTVFHAMQLKFFPPDLEPLMRLVWSSFRGANEADAEGGAGEKVKEAAKNSASKSKIAVEESAKSAAEAVQQTAEMVKEKLHDEL